VDNKKELNKCNSVLCLELEVSSRSNQLVGENFLIVRSRHLNIGALSRIKHKSRSALVRDLASSIRCWKVAVICN
jgi:hypothetical protein